MPQAHRILIVLLLLALSTSARGELKADELALIVNRNSAESIELADFYAKARQVPDGRIIELDVRADESISFEDYERLVVPQVRQALRDRGLEQTVKCLVTFYDLPLRIDERQKSDADTRELANLQAALAEVHPKLRAATLELERRAAAEDHAFRAGSGETVDDLAARIQRSILVIAKGIDAMPPGADRDRKTAEMVALSGKIREPLSTARSDPPSTSPAIPSAATQPATQPVAAMSQAQLLALRFDPAARRQLREMAARDGMIGTARVLWAQIDYLTPAETDAALDSELALLWWPTYGRSRWLPNALNYQLLNSRTPPVLMVARLDGPTPQKVKDIIAASVSTERTGLAGKVVIDAGGAIKLDPERKLGAFWPFEESFLRLSVWLKQRTRADIIFDDKVEILPPDSVKDVAIYTGWYNLGNYVPSCDFVPGAVGYHVASFELTSLRNHNGWCRGLLNDGVVATLGAVSEPYLHAFPPPDEFFPLLMTGRLTLAEVYWRTCPLASWKMCLVGDPLYTPYRVQPLLRESDLPQRLQPLLQGQR